MHRKISLCLGLGLLTLCFPPPRVRAAQPLTNQFVVVAENERTVLDRETGLLTSTVDVRAVNLGGREIEGPLHLVVETTPASGVEVVGAAGGSGQPPHGWPYFDVSPQLGALPLSPGGEIGVQLVFRRDRSLPLTYRIVPYGELDEQGAPTLNVPQAQALAEGDALTFTVEATDPDGDLAALAAESLPPQASFVAHSPTSGVFRFEPNLDQAGYYVVMFVARDSRGLVDRRAVEIEVLDANRPPTLAALPVHQVYEGELLTLRLTATDPDGEVPELLPGALPSNAYYFADTHLLTFAPDFSQAGSYDIPFTVVDGVSTGNTELVSIEVLDVPEADAVTNALTLVVNPVPSPALGASTRVTGFVNSAGGAIFQPVTTALITGLSPSVGRRGQTLEVELTGANSGLFRTAFALESQISFGEGITVSHPRVDNPQRLRVTVTVAADAALGARSVQVVTGGEAAFSVLGFNVQEGSSSVSGRVLAPGTGLPVAGAVVTLEGTSFRAITGSDGRFSFQGVPLGPLTLVINAPGQVPRRVGVLVEEGQDAQVGDLTAEATVFDPTAPAEVSVLSVVGRGATYGLGGRYPLDELRRMITDAFLVVGGTEAGVLDASGRQMNPQVEGDGLLSLTQAGVDRLALMSDRGDESVSLGELLYALSHGLLWQPGGAPTLAEWLGPLQALVDAAWARPGLPEHYLPLLLFNRGLVLASEPPQLTSETRLNPLQACLFLGSALATAADFEQGNVRAPAAHPLGDWTSAFFAPALAQAPGGGDRRFTGFWRGFHQQRGNFMLTSYNTAYSNYLTVMAGAFALGPSLPGVLGGIQATALAQGIATKNMVTQIRFQGLVARVPEPPVVKAVRIDREEGQQPKVVITFSPDPSHFPDQSISTYGMVYSLYRYRDPNAPRERVAGYLDIRSQSEVVNPLDGARVVMDNVNVRDRTRVTFTLEDPAPLRFIQDGPHVVLEPSATYFYVLLASRIIDPRTVITPQFVEQAKPFWQLPLGTPASLTPYTDRNIDGAAGVKYPLTSDYSKPLVVTATTIEQAPTREIEVHPKNGHVYSLDTSPGLDQRPKQDLYVEELEIGGGSRYFANAGFKAAGPGGFPRGGAVGLAVDAQGDVYSGNAASDEQFGGRIFRYNATTGARDQVGALNYYSLDLGFAHPSEIGPMDMGPGWTPNYSPQDLYVVDQLAGMVKKAPVQAHQVEGRRRVGQPWAAVPYQARVVDLETHHSGDAHALIERFPGLVLTATLAVDNNRLAPEEFIHITCKVRNASTSETATQVRVRPLLQEGEGSLAEHTLLTPSGVTLGPGEEATFTQRLRGVLPGRVLLRAVAEGQDSQGVLVGSAPEPPAGLAVFVESPLELHSFTALPRRVAPGGEIEVAFTLHNGGRGPVTGITFDLTDEPLQVSSMPTGSVSLVSAGAPATFDLEAGQSQVVTARYLAEDLGQIRFTARARGTYSETGRELPSNRGITPPVTITPLDFGLRAVPESVKLDPASSVQVILSVTNISNGTLTLIAPEIARSGGDAFFTQQANPLPLPFLGPGQSFDFPFQLSHPDESGQVFYEGRFNVVLPNLSTFRTDAEEVRILIGPTIGGVVYDFQPVLKPQLLPLIRRNVPLPGVHIQLVETSAGVADPQSYSGITDAGGNFRIAVERGGSYLLSGSYPGLNIGFKQPIYVKGNQTEGPRYEFTLPRTVIQQILDNREALSKINIEVPGSNVWFPFDNKNFEIQNSYDLTGVDQLLAFIRRGPNTPRFGGATVSAGGSQLWDAAVRLDFFLEDLRLRVDETKKMANSAATALVEILMAQWINKALDRDVFGKPHSAEAIQKKLVKGSPEEDLSGAVGMAAENGAYLKRKEQVHNATNAIRNFMKNKYVNQVMDRLPQGFLDYAFGRPVTKKDKEAVFKRVSKTIHLVLDTADKFAEGFNLKAEFGTQIAMALQIAITEALLHGYLETTQVFLNDFLFAAQDPARMGATHAAAIAVLHAHNQVLAAKNAEYYKDLELIAETNKLFKDANALNDDWKKYYKDKVFDGVKGAFKKAQDRAGQIAKPLKLIHVIGVAVQVGFLQPAEVCRMSKALLSGSLPTLDNDAEGAACLLIRF
jgi:hypothetical protein